MSKVKQLIKEKYQYECESLSESLIDWERIPKRKNDRDSMSLTLLGFVLCLGLIFITPLVAINKNNSKIDGDLLIMHVQNYTKNLSLGGDYDKN